MSEALETNVPMTVNDAPIEGSMQVNEPEIADDAFSKSVEKALSPKEEVKAEPQKKEEPKPTEKRKKKLVVDKKEIELELDDEAETKLFQKALAADKRLSEAAAERKELEAFAQKVHDQAQKVQQFLKDLDEDPRKVLLGRLGPQKFREIAEPLLYEEIKREQMDPKERAAIDAQRERDEYKAQLEARNKADEDKKIEDAKTQYAQEYQGLIIKRIETHGLPKTPGAIKAFAGYMQKALQRNQNLDDALLGRIAGIVREDNIGSIKELLSGFHEMAGKAEAAKDSTQLVKIGDELIELFGEQVVNLIRRSDLARLKSSQPQMPKTILETPRSTQEPQAKKGYMTEDEYKEDRRRRALEFDQANARS